MTNEPDLIFQDVPGMAEVKEWFGYWPSFHDAEIVSLTLNRDTDSRLRVHTFHTLNQTNERGHYRTTKHVVICFVLRDIESLELADFNHQNVISELELSKNEEGYSINLGCCYGLCGSIKAKSVTIELEPGIPDSSVYGRAGDLAT
jgi:hypothetical protein